MIRVSRNVGDSKIIHFNGLLKYQRDHSFWGAHDGWKPLMFMGCVQQCLFLCFLFISSMWGHETWCVNTVMSGDTIAMDDAEKWLKTSLKRYAKIPYSCLRLIKDLRQMSCDRMSNFQGKAYQLQLSLPHGPECHGMHLIYCLINIVYTASSRGLHQTGISLQIVAVTWVSLSYQAYKVGQTGQETTGPASCLWALKRTKVPPRFTVVAGGKHLSKCWTHTKA